MKGKRRYKRRTARFAPIAAGAILLFGGFFSFSGINRAETFCGAISYAGREETDGEKEKTALCRRRACGDRLPAGVTVDGIAVGGLPRNKAAGLLRRTYAERTPVLTVRAPSGDYTFRYPEIVFSDNLDKTLAAAERNGVYRTALNWRLNALDEKLEFILANNRLAALDGEARFSADGFIYEKERAGVFCDGEALKRDVKAALEAGGKEDADGVLRFPDVALHTRRVPPTLTLSRVKAGTAKLASFTTRFNVGDGGRSSNIALAAAKIDGLTLRPGEEFSFNVAVGARTEKNGFREAKIIRDGEFAAGIGGGVCQVSTTLYNAVLQAGLEVTARRPHSLAVSYVPPSRDAMVSSFSDFRFRNVKSFPVYLAMKARDGELTAVVYGRDDGYRVEIIAKITGEIPPPAPIEKAAESDCVIREGRAGIKSEAYIETYRYGKLLKREKLREDIYAPLRGIVGRRKSGKTAEK